MSRRALRTGCAAALAATVLASPAGAAPVDPAPGASGAAAPPAAAPATSDRSVAGLLTSLQGLYRQAEAATETYNGTAAELKKRTAQVKRLGAALVTARTALAGSRDDAGRLAREQYQGHTDFSAYLQLLLARDPGHALDQEHVIRRVAAGREATVKRLAGAEKRADELATASRKALDRQQVLAARQKKDRKAVEARLRAVTGMLATLSADQLTAVSRLEEQGVRTAQGALAASGALSSFRAPSAQGGEAVAYAVEQLGKPYVWGAEGPDAFDCSGLTSRAWARAGRTIPRTSQEQWRELPKVAMSALRPGDLVVYFPEATHVALYLGNGLVVQAPRPGARVKVSPVASNPVLGAVRPDPDATPLTSYTPPDLPDGAATGPDEGYRASTPPAR